LLWLRKKHRKQLIQQPFPHDWLEIIERNVLFYHYLPPEKQRELLGLVRVFLAEKRFEGCGGLEITDEIRLTITAQACILLLNLDVTFYPKLRSILVYPYGFVAPAVSRHPDGTVSEGFQPRLGESWSQGNVVLSWEDVLRGAANLGDGRNVVIHEFAHQLDSESGFCNGAPLLPRRSMYREWSRVLGREYEALVDSVEQGRITVIDKYGATSPAEFFAVVTELFFEKPLELESFHPELYEQLKTYYGQDPASLMRAKAVEEPPIWLN
jgi:Mlc titration factor MtfA (ptsG expression regulator)